MKFKLRTLIVVTALLALLASSIGRRYVRTSRQRKATSTLTASGANFRLDWPGRSWIDRTFPWLPFTYVPVAAVQAEMSANFGDGDLDSLKWIANDLQVLELQATSVTDRGIRKLDASKMANLYAINLSHTEVTDEGLMHLADFPALTDVVLQGCTHLTDEGIAEFHKRCDHFVRLHGTK